MIRRLDAALARTGSLRAVALLRIAVGPIVLLHLQPFLADALDGRVPGDTFTVPFSDWYPVLPREVYVAGLWVTAAMAVLLSIGLLTRLAAAFTALCRQSVRLLDDGREVVICSSGAIAVGARRLGWDHPGRTIPEKQAAAAVGQIGLEFCGNLLRAVAFETVNADDVGGYFDGLQVDCAAADDLSLPVGAAGDPNLLAAETYLATGACPVTEPPQARAAKIGGSDALPQVDRRGPPAREFLRAF